MRWALWFLVALGCGGAQATQQTAPKPVASASASASVVMAPPAGPNLEGVWRGVLGGALHTAVSFTQTKEGYTGMLNSIDQGATFPLEHIELAADGSVRFAISSVGGSFEGKVDAGSTKIEGMWTQSGHAQPLNLTKGKPGDPPVAKAEPPKPPLDAPIDVVVPQPPTAFHAHEHVHFVYEMHVTNLSRRELSLKRVEVRGAQPSPLLQADGDALALMCGRPGAPEAVGVERLKIGPGLRAVVYLWVTLDTGAPPTSLDHRITVQMAGDTQDLTVQSVRIPVRSEATPLVVSPPLHGKWWKAVNGPSNNSAHRRAFIAAFGHARIAQRFAIDWVKVGDDGKTYHDDATKNESYYAYGSEALAVADGAVTEVKDGIPQNAPGANRAVPITLETIGGNHVIVDIGGGRFAFWAHLQPGSVKVKVGDHVRRGQVLGLVGNSGNSTEPHLHFHVSDAGSPLGSEGLPYAFDSYLLQTALPGKITKQLPTQDDVVSFP